MAEHANVNLLDTGDLLLVLTNLAPSASGSELLAAANNLMDRIDNHVDAAIEVARQVDASGNEPLAAWERQLVEAHEQATRWDRACALTDDQSEAVFNFLALSNVEANDVLRLPADDTYDWANVPLATAWRESQRIRVIKAVRRMTGAGLKAAKEGCERYFA